MQYLAGEPYSDLINAGGDNLPGNMAYVSEERLRHREWPEEDPIHRLSIKALDDGRSVPPSLFVSTPFVFRVLQQVKSRVAATGDMTPAQLERMLRQAAERIDREIAQNIRRRPKLAAAYQRLLAAGAEPAVYLEDEK